MSENTKGKMKKATTAQRREQRMRLRAFNSGRADTPF